MRIAFVTQDARPELEDDDRPLEEALRARGHETLAVSWSDASFDWSTVELAFLRSPWDYYHRAEAFFGWLRRAGAATRVLNPPDVVRWNAHKGYMTELGENGAPVTPTIWVRRGETLDLSGIARSRGWTRLVLKPAVSADSWETIRIDAESEADRGRGAEYLARHRDERDILVQPFIASVDALEGGRGERCLVFFGGEFSHAVSKNSCFLGGRHAGAEGLLVEAAKDEIETARRVLDAARATGLPYARVDLARDAQGSPILLELELFEPTLFFSVEPRAAERCARAIEQSVAVLPFPLR
jgi:hypothetical protein